MKKIIQKAAGEQLYNRVVLPKHLGIALAENIKHGFPAKGLKVIGITGTNGKTTTSYMIHRMLVKSGIKAGLLTTVAYGVGNDLTQQIHHMTSQPIGLLLSRLETMKKQGMEVLVLEVTSHALAQFRTLGVPIDIAVMTNLTHEHLDYHGSFQAYRKAKLKLFKAAARNKKGKQLGIVNSDDPNAIYFVDAVPNVIGYSLMKSDDPNVLFPEDLKITPKGSSYTTTYNGEQVSVKCHIPGEFNVANSLAAVAVGLSLGLSAKQVGDGIASLDNVEGRMTRIDAGQEFDVIVDYAHTPDSFEKLLSDVRKVTNGNLLCLFGSAGRRDETKRAIQGKIAGKYADIVVVTEEDDRDIDGNLIMDQIASGAAESGKSLDHDLFKILDREEAIAFTLKKAKKGDTVMLLGKGHEKTIERADGEHPWDEIALTKKLLKK
ncbi:MAG: UDP-N-acetylmuramoyl-L-alanyl-D-glutamate--2,6-diaminopimelate ligase [Candidatus Saccharimonadales bacterium]